MGVPVREKKEASDPHGGGPGHTGDGRNGLNGVHIIGHVEVGYIIFTYVMHLPVAVRSGSIMPIIVKTEDILVHPVCVYAITFSAG